jgi:hypothetical protein
MVCTAGAFFFAAGLDTVVRLGAPATEGLRVACRVDGEREDALLLSGSCGVTAMPESLPSSQGSLFAVKRGLVLLPSVLSGVFLRVDGVPGPASAPVDIVTR